MEGNIRRKIWLPKPVSASRAAGLISIAPDNFWRSQANILGPSHYRMFVNIRYILPGILHDSILTLSSSLGAIVVLTLSSLNPLLRELVLDIDELQSIVLDNIRP